MAQNVKMINRRNFERNGYTVIRRLFDPAEVGKYRARVQNLSGLSDMYMEGRWFECPDGVSRNRQFWPLVVHPKLVDVIRGLLGRSARYTQHSDIHAHRGGVGWHRDSSCRTFRQGPDWDEARATYRVVRVAIYLQTYEESGSSLGVLPGSHRYEEVLSARERAYWRRMFGGVRRLGLMGDTGNPLNRLPGKLVMRTKKSMPYVTPPARPVWIRTEPGDCIIFDQRLYHSASRIHGPKYAIYLSYGVENEHSRNHLRYYLYHRRDLGYRPLDPELAERLREVGLYMEPPEPKAVSEFTSL